MSDDSHASIGIAGAGRLAQALGRLLRERGEPVVALASRNPDHAAAAARFIGPIEALPLSELPAYASRILIAVSDDAIAAVAQELHRGGFTNGIALHVSGASPVEILQALRDSGIACGSMHPLQTIATPEQGVASLPGCSYAITGDAQAIEWAEEITGKLGGRVLRIPSDLRPLYHAAGVLASNALTGILAASVAIFQQCGIAERDALNALAPLSRTSLDNALANGPVQALTGPVVRGDAKTVASHLEALKTQPVEIQDLYRASARQLLTIARARGAPEERIQAILQLIQE